MAFNRVTFNGIRISPIHGLKLGLVLSLVALGVVATAGQSIAHGTTIEYRTTQALEVQATYDSGEPMANAQVVVYAPDDPSEAWLTGVTDERGQFLFSPDPSMTGNWDVQIRQAGHGDIVSIPVGESDAIATSEGSTPDRSSESSAQTSSEESGTDVALLSSPSGSTSALSPLQKVIMAASVVWGLFGTAMFFAARSKKNAHS